MKKSSTILVCDTQHAFMILGIDIVLKKILMSFLNLFFFFWTPACQCLSDGLTADHHLRPDLHRQTATLGQHAGLHETTPVSG